MQPPDDRFSLPGVGVVGRLHRSSSFLHGLPPPIPSATAASPRGYFPPSPRDVPSPSGGMTDPGSWTATGPLSAATSSNSGGGNSGNGVGGGSYDPRPNSSRARWSPTIPSISPRYPESGTRLPSLADYPHRPPVVWGDVGGGGPSPASYPIIHKRESLPNSTTNSTYRSPGVMMTPNSGSGDFYDSRDMDLQSRGEMNLGGGGHAGGSGDGDGIGKHDSEPPGDGEQPKKKKRRQALSCAECAKRKQKCNRETPCQHCVSRKVPHLCIPYSRIGTPPPRTKQPKTDPTEVGGSAGARGRAQSVSAGGRGGVAGKSSPAVGSSRAPSTGAPEPLVSRPPAQLPTMAIRVGKVEKMLNAVLNRIDGLESKALEQWRATHAVATSPRLLSATLNVRPDTASSGSIPLRGRDSVENELNEEEGWLDVHTRQRNPLPQTLEGTSAAMSLELDYHGTVGEQLQHIAEESTNAAGSLQRSLQDLPSREFADRLIDWFFTKVNYVRYPIDQRLFMQAYEAVYASRTQINPSMVLALPLVFAVLAIAIRVAPDEWAGAENERRALSLKLFWGAQFAIMISTSINAENLQLVETRILLGLYLVLMHERRLAEGWLMFRAAIATGQAIGLHRDGTRLRLDPYMTEYRRRLWSYLCHADSTYSCLLGRPTSIDPMYYDTHEPYNIDLSDLIHTTSPKSQRPLEETTFATYLIFRKRLADIVAKITRHFQKLHGPAQYRDVEAIDTELKRLREELPPQFRITNPDKSMDHDIWYLAVHRPWILRRLKSSRYSLSRNACFEAAVTDFKIREAFRIDTPDFFETLLGGSFREFNTAMIAGISLLINPSSAHAGDMWKIMANFMDHHPHDPKKDDFSKKESAIIYTLQQRAASRPPVLPTSHPLQENTSFERGSPHDMAAPPVPRPDSATGSHGAGQAASTGGGSGHPTPVVGRSPNLSYGANYGLQPTPPELGPSPEDQAQTLFNQFLLYNSDFGPNAGGTFNPYGGFNPLVMASTPYGLDTSPFAGGGVNGAGVGVGVPGPVPGGTTGYLGGWQASQNQHQQQMYNAAQDGSSMGTAGPSAPGPMTMSVNATGVPVAAATAAVNGLAPGSMMASQFGDVNTSQYWNTFIDAVEASGNA